jgi:hypothetical protein
VSISDTYSLERLSLIHRRFKMKVIIDTENKRVKDEKGYYEVCGYTNTFGYAISLESLLNYQDGKKLTTKEEEEEINEVYKKLFVEEK